MRKIDTKETFDKYGIINTKQRNLVFEILKRADNPITAEDIFIKTQKYNTTMNFSTVYRVLNTFMSKGLVRKTILREDDKSVFELNLDEHKHYLICTSCNKMIKISYCPLQECELKIGENNKFRITGHKLELYGHCEDCTNHS